ncbi:MAG: PorT family protein [Microscillaceae bacterium]|jgi:hypothetical protein|nr:PorT family protein [Microscillaceae bacterium]
MQTPYFWNQYRLQGQKNRLICLFFLLAFFTPYIADAQWFIDENRGRRYSEDAARSVTRNRNFKRPIAFGFYGGVMRSGFYAQSISGTFNENGLLYRVDNVFEKSSLGFSIGFYSNFRISEFWDFRAQLNAAFYQRRLVYKFGPNNLLPGISIDTEVPVESSMLEIPLLFKYRSQLRGIAGMYFIGGIKPSIALGRGKTGDLVVGTSSFDASIEYGLGFDVFFPFFKFAPELRFSHGLVDVLKRNNNFYDRPLQRLTTHTATLYFHFGG